LCHTGAGPVGEAEEGGEAQAGGGTAEGSGRHDQVL